jgi:hypothetical protein
VKVLIRMEGLRGACGFRHMAKPEKMLDLSPWSDL